jgi:leucyl-tRNA synthetase
LAFNTAISQMMILVNEIYKRDTLPKDAWEALIRMLAPYAPHLAEELWEMQGNRSPVSLAAWPEFHEEFTKDDQTEIVLQVNGKIRSRMTVAAGTPREALQDAAMKDERIAELVTGKEVVKVIAVPDKLVNVVVK